MNDIKKLNALADEIGIKLSDEKLEQFLKYYNLLIEWNEKINLTSITEFHDVLIKHFIDSIALCKASENSIINDACFSNKEIKLIDVGCGAGFPSIPLKIAYPNINVTMLDSLNKRVNFLNEVISELGLTNIKAVHGRAEDYAKPDLLRENFDIAVSRAVANLSTLSEYCMPYVKQGGIFVAYKSEELLLVNDEKKVSEKDNAKSAIHILGGHIENIYEYNLPTTDLYRCLLVISKDKVTPKKYPRKAGLPSKEPLK